MLDTAAPNVYGRGDSSKQRLQAVTLLPMTTSGRGRWERVLAARRQARLALGKDPAGVDDYGGRPKPRSPQPAPPSPTPIAPGPGVPVLTVGEAATRLGMSRAQFDAMIAHGSVETLPIEFGRVIPTHEVDRLQRTRTDGP